MSGGFGLLPPLGEISGRFSAFNEIKGSDLCLQHRLMIDLAAHFVEVKPKLPRSRRNNQDRNAATSDGQAPVAFSLPFVRTDEALSSIEKVQELGMALGSYGTLGKVIATFFANDHCPPFGMEHHVGVAQRLTTLLAFAV